MCWTPWLHFRPYDRTLLKRNDCVLKQLDRRQNNLQHTWPHTSFNMFGGWAQLGKHNKAPSATQPFKSFYEILSLTRILSAIFCVCLVTNKLVSYSVGQTASRFNSLSLNMVTISYKQWRYVCTATDHEESFERGEIPFHGIPLIAPN